MAWSWLEWSIRLDLGLNNGQFYERKTTFAPAVITDDTTGIYFTEIGQYRYNNITDTLGGVDPYTVDWSARNNAKFPPNNTLTILER